ncbi:AGAP006088-PA-like protein [Anopheles sinensis]|uniref:AGAP006088-PA-like protein n=1 Tax=Anopheles sinensis TaxID=74873 RepID=A0A084VD75_ANOSI|nr:AGAP006088-PA-like protein [Anopheles sinensis]
MTVNVVNNSLQVYWENVDYKKYYLVLAGHGNVIYFHKKGEGNFEYWENSKQYVYEVIKPTRSSSFNQTGIRFNRSELDWVGNVKNHGYYVHMTTPAGIVVKTYCMRAYPTWMNDYKSQIGDISLNQLFIPGTYQSASYMTEVSAVDYEIKHKYSITQGWEDVRSQLRLGARYLDIRVGRYTNKDVPYWTANSIVKMHLLRQILEQVRKFVEETNEIVIFDIHGFTVGLDRIDDHETLIDYIRERIGYLMVSPSIGWDGTLNQIWATGKRIIVCYANAEVVNLYPYHLWPTTHHRLADVDDKIQLKNYLYNKQSTYR